MRVDKAAGALGAYVKGVSLADAAGSADLFSQVREALLTHQVLFFRDQDISPIEYQAFARRFGQVEGHPAYQTVPDAPDVQILESTPEAPSKIEVWHTDMTFRPAPPAITLLHGQIIPAYGGDTLWASIGAAYEGLSEPMRTLVDESVPAQQEVSIGSGERGLTVILQADDMMRGLKDAEVGQFT